MLGEIDAPHVPELLVVNKCDIADRGDAGPAAPGRAGRGRRLGPDRARPRPELAAAIEARLPRPSVEMRVLLPYDRGDLVSRVHSAGEVLTEEHTADGTLLAARVSGDLAGMLSRYAVADG